MCYMPQVTVTPGITGPDTARGARITPPQVAYAYMHSAYPTYVYRR